MDRIFLFAFLSQYLFEMDLLQIFGYIFLVQIKSPWSCMKSRNINLRLYDMIYQNTGFSLWITIIWRNTTIVDREYAISEKFLVWYNNLQLSKLDITLSIFTSILKINIDKGFENIRGKIRIYLEIIIKWTSNYFDWNIFVITQIST